MSKPPRGPARPSAHFADDRPYEPGVGKPERLQKILAHAGLGSRRSCEEYILKGRVTIDGQVARELGVKVDPEKSTIAVDGEKIKLERMVYYAVNKPKGYVSTNNDPSGRPRVVDLLPEIPERVYTVGRLDEDSTGLIILTNDGELANRLAHPRFGVEKIYRALVAGSPSREILAKMTEGIWLSDGKVRAKRVRVVGSQGDATNLEMVLAEGKKREIRRMLAKLGHKVMSLARIAIGPVVLKGLPIGESRPLMRSEVELLRKVAAGFSVSTPTFLEPSRGGTRLSRGPGRAHTRPQNQAQRPGRGSDQSSEGRPPSRPEARPGSRLPGKPPTGRENRPADRPTGRPARPIEARPAGKPPGKPPTGRENRPAGRPQGPAGSPGKPIRQHPSGEGPSGPPPEELARIMGRTRKAGGGRGKPPALDRKVPGPKTKHPPQAPPLGAKVARKTEPPADRPPVRKIIGLEQGAPAEATRSMAGRPPLKRPNAKKRPPQRGSRLKRSAPENDGAEGSEE